MPQFIVYPVGVMFPLHVNDNGETHLRAQVAAARLSAQMRMSTYVMRDDIRIRMGLGPDGLAKVLVAGAPAFWDSHSRAWYPAPEDLQGMVSSKELAHH